jgi:hypothetical protein
LGAVEAPVSREVASTSVPAPKAPKSLSGMSLPGTKFPEEAEVSPECVQFIMNLVFTYARHGMKDVDVKDLYEGRENVIRMTKRKIYISVYSRPNIIGFVEERI